MSTFVDSATAWLTALWPSLGFTNTLLLLILLCQLERN